MRIGLLDQRGDDVGHVEERRQQVVGEVAVADHPVDLDDLLHHRQPEALGDAALDLAEHRQRVQRPADVLRRGDLHDLDQAQLGIDVDDGAVGDEGERRVAVALAVLVEFLGRRMAVLDGLVELDAGGRLGDRQPPTRHRVDDVGPVDGEADRVDAVDARPTCSNSRSRTGRQAASTAPPLIHVWRDADVEPAEPTSVSMRSSTTSSTPRIVRAICGAIVTKPWPTSEVANFSVATPSARRQRAVE